MSPFEKISPDDPRLTTFALGEMEPAERAEFEKRLQQDADARAIVAGITGTAHHLGVALAHEPVPTFAPVSIEPAVSALDREYSRREGGMGKMLRFPQLYFTISGLAAACFAVAFLIWQTRREPLHYYTAVELTQSGPADSTKAKAAAEGGAGLEVGLQPATLGAEGGAASLDKGERDNAFLTAKGSPVSTFPIKTGTVSYGNVRHFIEHGQRPTPESVRIEELVNYFPYQYSPPEDLAEDREVQTVASVELKSATLPFAAHLEVASAPWAPEHRLVRIGLKGREVQQLSATNAPGRSMIIAKDVKLQVEFNPAQVQAYRLIGYENRMSPKEQVNAEKIDAGEINAGHTVTALYEIVPAGAEWKAERMADGSKYRTTASQELETTGTGELLTLKLSYQAPEGEADNKLEFPLRDTGRTFDDASADFKFAASVAAFGMILRESPHKGQSTYAHVTEWARAGLMDDVGGYRAKFVGLVGQAERLAQN